MIELYTWTTPNGRKPVILLEELGIEYEIKAIRLNGEQRSPQFLKLNPNGRIPAMVDHDVAGAPITLFESGAIMVYLAEKSGRFLPKAEPERSLVMQWLMFQMGGVGPMFGQLGHFMFAGEKVPYAIERYRNEVQRLYRVLDVRLGESEYLGNDYSIADMITYPWTANPSYYEMTLDDYPNVKRWTTLLATRPAVQKAMALSLRDASVTFATADGDNSG